jgi:putative spermidine/putrescine transport system ATP-binding protein
MTVSLTIENLSAHYGQTQVLKDLSISVAAGDSVSLLGSYGCG